jgi:ABC-type nitrate/sulfonate/bicarbonate transport system substrate-binding protein
MRVGTHGWLLILALVLGAACAGGGSPPAPSPATSLPAAPGAAAAAPRAAARSNNSPTTAPNRPALVAQPLNPPETVRVASIGLAGQAPTYLAMDLGYFAELGIAVELVNMPGGGWSRGRWT